MNHLRLPQTILSNSTRIVCILALFTTGGLAAQSEKKAPDFRFPARATVLKIKSGGEAKFNVTAIVPAHNHIYVKHASEISLNILTAFQTSTPGWAIAVEKAPAGKRYKDDFVLTGRGKQPAGTYAVKLYETKGRAAGPKIHTVNVEVKTQMCNSKTNLCYRPTTVTKEVRVRVTKNKTRTAALPKQRGGVAWVQNYKKALSEARNTGRNIFVVITAPEWCGYCKVLEARVFSKHQVAQALNKKFVPLQLLDTNSDRKKFRFDGYPTMLIAGANGKKIAEVYGRDENSFLSAIKKYEKDDGGQDSNTDTSTVDSFDFSIQVTGNFKKTGTGWERRTKGGKTEKFTEHRRSKKYIILKSVSTGEFVALPIKGGKGLIYRNSAWEPAFDVKKKKK